MKILISPIGLSDPISERGEGPALILCRYHTPDVVFLLPTAERLDIKDSTYGQAENTQEQLETILPNTKVYIRALDVSDPTDFSQILPRLRIIINSILAQTQNYPEREFFINVSSATPQIQAACLLAASSGLPPAKALQVADPRYAPNGERWREVPLTLLQEAEQIDKVARLFQGYLFDTCIEELKSLERLTPSRQRRDAAENWRLLCKAYAALDRLDYETAGTEMTNLREKIRNTQEYHPVASLLEEQLSTLKELKGSIRQEDKLILTDIFHNACRRFQQGNFADTLARIWRAIEGGMFYRLRQYGIEPSDLAQSSNPKQAQKLKEAGLPQHLSFETSLRSLKDVLDDEAFSNFLTEKRRFSTSKKKKLREWMEGLRAKRNNSLVGHGVQPVEEKIAQEGVMLAEAFLIFLFAELKLSQYPFSPEKLALIKEHIRKII